jgi:hypothetical protein
VLGKIVDETLLKRAMKANARMKKQSQKSGLKHQKVYSERRSAASKKTLPSPEARELVRRHNRKGYS